MKNLFGSIAAVAYFIFPMSLVILLLLFMPFGFLMDVSTIRTSGFAGPNTAASFIGMCGLFIGLSLLIPPLRKMYRALPWFYPFIKIFYVDLVILNIGLAILNYGYQVISEVRHTLFFILMIVQIALCRLAMCYYFKLKPVKRIETR